MTLLAPLEKRGRLFWVTIGSIGVAAAGLADFLTGRELAFSLFYLIPILLVTWFAGRNLGLAMSAACAIAWFTADALTGQSYSEPVIRYWNAAVRLSFFVLVTLLLPALKALEREKEVARVDQLTGASNRRHFFEAAQRELDRSQRYKHPFTIVYIDLDDFKAVNDQWGHRAGDQLLCAVVHRAKRLLRKTDFLARSGGDEFIVLLPETDQEAARVTVSKIQLALLDEMRGHHWPVTFSMGALTCIDARIPAEALIKKADDLMYSVKKNGKNAVAYAIYAG
jgi:diguanylate cyclase (GGDEF)-like protein